MLLLCCSVALQARTVTFEHPCANSAVVLEALGKEIGRTIKPSGSVNKDYFLLRFDGVPVGEAMTKIAETLNATWTEKEGVLYLGRTLQQESLDQKETREAEAKFLQEGLSRIDLSKPYDQRTVQMAIENALKSLRETNDESPLDGRQILAMNEMSPAARYVARLCKEIGYETIVDTGEFGVVEYVPRPGQLQRALGHGESLRQFQVETQTLLNSIDPATRLEAAKYGLETSLFSPFSDPDQTPYLFDALRVRRTERFIHLAYYSKESGDYDALYWIRDRKPIGIAQELLEQHGKYEPTAMETALVDYLSRRLKSDYGAHLEIDPALAMALRDPVASDPLDVFGSRWILGSAKSLGKNVVALLADDAYLVSCDSMSKNMYDFRAMWSALGTSGGGYTGTSDETWITVRPRKRDIARIDRADRVRWGNLLRTIQSDDLSIEQIAGFYALSDSPRLCKIAVDCLGYSKGLLAVEQFDVDSSTTPLSVYGRLLTEQQNQAKRDWVTFEIPGMTKSELRTVGALALAGPGQISPTPYDGRLYNLFSRGPQTPKTDPIKVFANGFPANGRLRIRVDEFPLLYQKAQGKDGWHKRIEPNGSGISYAAMEGTMYLSLFTISASRQLIVEFDWPDVGYQTFTFQQHLQPRDVEWVTLDNLPKDFQEWAKLALKPSGQESGGG